jgi:hypothetical protein
MATTEKEITRKTVYAVSWFDRPCPWVVGDEVLLIETETTDPSLSLYRELNKSSKRGVKSVFELRTEAPTKSQGNPVQEGQGVVLKATLREKVVERTHGLFVVTKVTPAKPRSNRSADETGWWNVTVTKVITHQKASG